MGENRWKTSEPCDKCGKPLNEHRFREVITCIYGGSELKDGGTWDRSTTDEVVDRIVARLGDGDGAP